MTRPGQNVYRLGQTGEKLAGLFLEKKGLKIIERNFRIRGGEIDLVARDGNFLVFVEVKTSYNSTGESPVFRVNNRKQARLVKAAEAYLVKRNIGENQAVRFDVVTVEFMRGKPHVEHIENAFWAEPEK